MQPTTPPPEDRPEQRAPAGARAASGAERKPFLLRLAPDVMEELRAWASQDLRSLNGQIEFLLREALRRRRGDKG